MSKGAILKIKAAEDEAIEIRQSIGVKIKALLSDEEKKGIALCEKRETAALEKAKIILEQAQIKADKIVAENQNIATEEAIALIKSAEKNMHAAVKIVVEGVGMQWQ